MCEHNQILVHITPHHAMSNHIMTQMQTLNANPKNECDHHETSVNE